MWGWILGLGAGAVLLPVSLVAVVAVRSLRPPNDGGAVLPPPLAARARTLEAGGRSAWLLPPDEGPPRGLVILVHGWGSHAANMITWFSFLADAGWACLAFDVRGHGPKPKEGEANLNMFAEDVQGVVDWVSRDPELSGLPRALLGHSMGGAAVLLALSRGAGAGAAVVSSAFARTSTLLHHVLRRWLLPPFLFAPVVRGVWRIRVGRNLEAMEPRRTIGAARVPLLLVHGTEDPLIPDREIEHLEAQAPPGTEVLRVEGGHHSDLPDFAAYREPVLAFLDRRLR